MSTLDLRIIQLKRGSALVEEAFLLAESARESVDYSARECFAQAASEGLLWAAVGEGPAEGRLLGYALAYLSGGELLLSQVLVPAPERGQGIGTRLVEALVVWAGERSLPVITLAPEAAEPNQRGRGCWLRWGFTVRRSASAGPVSGYAGQRLEVLERETAPDLFSGAGTGGGFLALEGGGEVPGGLKALLDPDLFEELAQCPALEAETELRALASGRFRREFAVSLAAETAEEMARGHSRDPRGRTAAAREKRVQALAHFPRVTGGGLDLEPYRARATRLLRESEEAPQSSDYPIEELALAAALGVPVFLTLNEAVLQREDPLYRELGLTVTTPTGALLRLAILHRESEYSPIRLHAECLRAQPLPEDFAPRLADRFLAAEYAETRATLLHKLERFSVGVRQGDCRRLLIGAGGHAMPPPAEGAEEVPPLSLSLQALLVLLRNREDILRVPLWRIPEHPLRPTFARQILVGLVEDALAEGRRLILVQDGFMPADLTGALRENGFLPAGADTWVRVLAKGAQRPRAWSMELRALPELDPVTGPAVTQLQNYLAPKANGIPKEDFLALERLLAPGRLLGADLPTYLVQMKPGWAMRVFDAELAEYDLFEGTRRATLRPREAVIFLPLNAGGGEAAQALPGRVIWQVCSRGGSGLIRAVSNLAAVETGAVGELYRKYRRLGYFTEKDVLSMAGPLGSSRKADPEAEASAGVCAWVFADTWLLPRPLPWAEAARLLEETENRTQFGPVSALSQESFHELLREGSQPAPVPENNDLGLLWD